MTDVRYIARWQGISHHRDVVRVAEDSRHADEILTRESIARGEDGWRRSVLVVDLDELPEHGWGEDSDERFQFVERMALKYGERLDRLDAARANPPRTQPKTIDEIDVHRLQSIQAKLGRVAQTARPRAADVARGNAIHDEVCEILADVSCVLNALGANPAKGAEAPWPVPVTVSEPSFFRVSPDPSDPGWRIRVERAPGELTQLIEEQVLPERVNKRANRVIDTRTDMWLTAKDSRWLHGVFGELLRELDAEDPAVSEQTPGYGDNDEVVRSRRADRGEQHLCGRKLAGTVGNVCGLPAGHSGAHQSLATGGGR